MQEIKATGLIYESALELLKHYGDNGYNTSMYHEHTEGAKGWTVVATKENK